MNYPWTTCCSLLAKSLSLVRRSRSSQDQNSKRFYHHLLFSYMFYRKSMTGLSFHITDGMGKKKSMKKLKKQKIIPLKSLGVPHWKPQGAEGNTECSCSSSASKALSFHLALKNVILAGFMALTSGETVCLSPWFSAETHLKARGEQRERK